MTNTVCPHCGYDFPAGGQSSAGSPCHICGGNAYSWGSLKDSGQLFAITFVEDGNSLTNAAFLTIGEEARARLCNGCGNIQLFAQSFTH